MNFSIIVSLTILSSIGLCNGGKVLFYMPFISESVKITFMPVAKELAARGHAVTIVTPFPDKSVDSLNLRQISFDNKFMVDSIRQMSKSKLNPDADASFPIFDLFNIAFTVSSISFAFS